MSSRLVFFFRRKNPAFFSIERVFHRIAASQAIAGAGAFSVESRELPFENKLTRLRENIRYARGSQGDVNHMTGDAHYIMLGFSRRKANVLTIHDCVLLHRLSRTSPRFWFIKWLWYDLPVRKADVVTVISESTRKDLLRFVPAAEKKIRVIPNFIDPAFSYSARDFREQEPRILFVGVTPNKNLERLAAALEGISCTLVIIGEPDPAQTAILERFGIRYERHVRLSQEELLAQYRDCDILAFPSLFEGFGLPIIEGQAIGRPVLTSRLSPMQEVAGDGACLIDPYSTASIREGLLRIIREKGYREALVEAGRKNVGRYGLEEVAGQYARLYEELISEKRIKK
ncbi:MAG TPA: glycosyltransferase family 1 protein [Puia sp.]|nr:glycosyltransferase family 1 protein [Puia sp.]